MQRDYSIHINFKQTKRRMKMNKQNNPKGEMTEADDSAIVGIGAE